MIIPHSHSRVLIIKRIMRILFSHYMKNLLIFIS